MSGPPTSACAFVVMLAALSLPQLALADDASDCSAGDGTLLVGTVVTAPSDVPGKPVRGIPLRHTHIRIRGDADGKTYDRKHGLKAPLLGTAGLSTIA